MADPKRAFALRIVRQLQDAGYEAYWAGGCVRDLIMGATPQDYDVATSARPDEVRRLFSPRTHGVGASFGVVVVTGRRLEGQVEVATFRSDGTYSDGRHPDYVQYGTARQDALRRDFTINGIFLDPVRQQEHDFVGGHEDIRRGVIRAIGDPVERFHEDKLRILRGVRFAARFGFQLDPDTARAMRTMAPHIRAVSPERIQKELRFMLVDPNRVAAIRLADQSAILHEIVPEVDAMHGIPQDKPVQPQGDLWEHSLLTLDMLQRSWTSVTAHFTELSGPPSFTLALACLLHDIGKPITMERVGDRLTFHNHEHAGKRLADDITTRLRFSNRERERVCWLVAFHMYLGDARQMRLSKLKRILVHEGIAELLALHHADALASDGDTQHVAYCLKLLQELTQTELNPPPLLSGHDLVRLGLQPGPQFKWLLDKVREAQLEGTIKSKRDAIQMVQNLIEANQAEKQEEKREDKPDTPKDTEKD